jgi:hypothetical protein
MIRALEVSGDKFFGEKVFGCYSQGTASRQTTTVIVREACPREGGERTIQ